MTRPCSYLSRFSFSCVTKGGDAAVDFTLYGTFVTLGSFFSHPGTRSLFIFSSGARAVRALLSPGASQQQQKRGIAGASTWVYHTSFKPSFFHQSYITIVSFGFFDRANQPIRWTSTTIRPNKHTPTLFPHRYIGSLATATPQPLSTFFL